MEVIQNERAEPAAAPDRSGMQDSEGPSSATDTHTEKPDLLATHLRVNFGMLG